MLNLATVSIVGNGLAIPLKRPDVDVSKGAGAGTGAGTGAGSGAGSGAGIGSIFTGERVKDGLVVGCFCMVKVQGKQQK